MKRLWARISLAFTIVIIFGMLMPLVIGIATREFRYEEVPPPQMPEPPAGVDAETWKEQWESRRAEFLPGGFIVRNLIPQLIGVTLVSIIAGVLLSRNLGAPLSKLAEAARSIGARDLSQRVDVRGSQEVQEVVQAFNEMAGDLQQAETLRQNLLADVAHELRTPITVIQGNLQAILDDVYALDKAEIAQLYDQTRHLTRLVDDLRELAQAEAQQLALEMTSFDLGYLVQEIFFLYEPIAESEGIELQTRISESPLTIQADRARLTQCLQNLLNNAFRYTPAGGRITLCLQRGACGSADGGVDFIELRLSDTGSGIAREHLPRVFDRFYRADPSRSRATGSTGLGLAITRALIESHGGKISAESQGEGKGSSFIVRLPAVEAFVDSGKTTQFSQNVSPQ